ncbi:MAG: hypothetical protein CVV47_09400 [Spirochaetae bacterium HGW-Spirochaetae-3]|nr:MAG: hypothetical protein CVV47_09400 [Spirochaetae bacterium HGW-Spirochaetae-3]
MPVSETPEAPFWALTTTFSILLSERVTSTVMPPCMPETALDATCAEPVDLVDRFMFSQPIMENACAATSGGDGPRSSIGIIGR